MNTNGLTHKDWKQFNDLLIKANGAQLYSMDALLSQEIKKRGL